MARFGGNLLCFALLATCAHAQLNVSIPLLSNSSSPCVSPSLISLSIEFDRFPDWAGNTSRNEFFYNTLDNLKQITGQLPHIRIGGNTEDKTNFSRNAVFAEDIFPAYTATTPYPEANNITIGNSYYETARFLPPGTHVTWGVNFGQYNLTAAVSEAAAVADAFASPEIASQGIVLDYIEIGNEADLYKNNGLRASNYNITDYVAQWLQFAGNVSEAARINAESHTKFLGLSFAGSANGGTGFSPEAAFSAGILTGPGQFISTGSFCTGSGGLLANLMNKASIRGNLTAFAPDIQATFDQGLDYILGETNSYSCHGAPGVSNTAGAALWTLDYALFATQLGISVVHFHDGIGFKYNLIQPITLFRSTLDGSTLDPPQPAHVQPQYYSAIIAGEAIGNTGRSQVVEISIDDDNVSGYGIYENHVLVRAVFINSEAYLSTDTNRTSTHIDLGFVVEQAKIKTPVSMTLKRLAIECVPFASLTSVEVHTELPSSLATDVSGLTWGGQTYETPDGRVANAPQTQTLPVSSGIDISETELRLNVKRVR
ncbi:hypothetical protein H0H92_002899 [Tricholoma furcatifolium]|nr:hypothetical protein H0H92_002899 [Tricholoma furcatifolium]